MTNEIVAHLINTYRIIIIRSLDLAVAKSTFSPASCYNRPNTVYKVQDKPDASANTMENQFTIGYLWISHRNAKLQT